MATRDKIEKIIKDIAKMLGIESPSISIEHPADLAMGDYSTNIAFVLAKDLKTSPKELAAKILSEIQKDLPKEVEKVEVAGAGFINFYFKKEFFHKSIEDIISTSSFGDNHAKKGKQIMLEYTQPNPFKPFHIGHLMTNAIGESLSRILEASGAKVVRANYQGDVGLHVAKAMYILLKDPNFIQKDKSTAEQARLIGEAYSKGAHAYENEDIKKEIDEINRKIYQRSDEKINEIYDWGFKVTMEAFEDIYDLLGTQFDVYFLESKVAPLGEQIVRDNIGKVFVESEGAIVFKGEEHDKKLHTRVFINSGGLPMYEAKEIGLIETKFKENPNLDLSIVTTAREQSDYMKVVEKAFSLINPTLAGKMRHISHGMMRFASGKMSSRLGNVITGESLIRDVRSMVLEKIKERDFTEDKMYEVASMVSVAAIKYPILRQSIGGDIVFDVEESLSFEGDSGPYLQYSYARARSIIAKSKVENIPPDFINTPKEISTLEKMLYRFPEVIERAGKEMEPHHIAGFLIEISRSFNSFYGESLIVDKKDATSGYKVALTYAFSMVLERGLYLLGIKHPEKM